MLLDVVLDFLLQLLRALGALDEHDAGLDDLPAHLVRRSGHAALKHIRQLHDDVFDLERPDAVAGGLDDVVRAANIPVETVLIAPREVAGVVESVVPDGLSALLVLIIAEEQPAEVLSSRGMDDDLACVAVGSRGAVLIDKVDAVAGDGLAHRAGLERLADEVRNAERHLRLAEALGDLQPRRLFKLIIDLRVQRLARGRCVLDGTEVEAGQILLDQHPVHRGRRTERCDVVFGEHRQNLLGVEPIKVVDEHRTLAQPLAIQLAPERLAPAGLGDREVQSAGLHPVPVAGRDVMAQRIFVAVNGDLRIAGRAGREEHEHRIVAAGRVVLARVAPGEQAVFRVKVVPALALAADENLRQMRTRVGLRDVDLMCRVAVRRTDDRAHARRLEAIGEIMLHQLVRRRDGDRAQLMQAEDRKPELIVPLEHQHHAVAALHAE